MTSTVRVNCTSEEIKTCLVLPRTHFLCGAERFRVKVLKLCQIKFTQFPFAVMQFKDLKRGALMFNEKASLVRIVIELYQINFMRLARRKQGCAILDWTLLICELIHVRAYAGKLICIWHKHC